MGALVSTPIGGHAAPPWGLWVVRTIKQPYHDASVAEADAQARSACAEAAVDAYNRRRRRWRVRWCRRRQLWVAKRRW